MLSFSAHWLVYAALAFHAAGFAVRDELVLRALVVTGSLFYIAYYFFVQSDPLWDAIFASAVLISVNLVLITIIVRERTLFAMPDDHVALFRQFGTLNPGQFRKLLAIGTETITSQPVELTREGEHLEHLYYVVSGTIEGEKRGATFRLPPSKFIGEIAFLQHTPASATIRLEPGAHYITWERNALRKLMARSIGFSNALLVLLSRDLSAKVVESSGQLSLEVANNTHQSRKAS